MYHAAAEEGLWIVMATVRGETAVRFGPSICWDGPKGLRHFIESGLAPQCMHNTFELSK